MDPHLVSLVKSSFDHVDSCEGGRSQFTHSFYAFLFAMRPDARQLFSNIGDGENDRLITEFRHLVNRLHDGTSVIDDLRELGAYHHRFQLGAPHFLAVGSAMICALVEFYGPDRWPDELDNAWRVVYSQMASVMMRAVPDTIVQSATGTARTGTIDLKPSQSIRSWT
ncbi:globin domain-containing protein [Rhodococcus qingshengii]|uniref:globin domain-containing protein n=1 Tax=Rhodococcus qingshengii TaxID=334542 RepID=UPI003017EA2C